MLRAILAKPGPGGWHHRGICCGKFAREDANIDIHPGSHRFPCTVVAILWGEKGGQSLDITRNFLTCLI